MLVSTVFSSNFPAFRLCTFLVGVAWLFSVAWAQIPIPAPMPQPVLRTSQGPADLIWIEGESADSTTAIRHSWYDSVRKTGLSGNDWLPHFAGKPARATYSFRAPSAGTYTFWVRANPQGRPVLRYSLDKGPMEQVDFTDALQRINIAVQWTAGSAVCCLGGGK